MFILNQHKFIKYDKKLHWLYKLMLIRLNTTLVTNNLN